MRDAPSSRPLRDDGETRRNLEEQFGRPINLDVEIIHFVKILGCYGLDRLGEKARRSLKGVKFVPYYGCTLFRPPRLARQQYFQGEMENILTALGAEPVTTALSHRCCGSFLSATAPEVVTPLVNEIIDSAVAARANCRVTACASLRPGPCVPKADFITSMSATRSYDHL